MAHQTPSISRRQFLGGTAVTGLAGLAGCLGTFVGGSGRSSFDPVEPAEPPEGTPNEFYYVLEERLEGYEITVDAMYEHDGDLILQYRSTVDADLAEEDVDEPDSNEADSSAGDDATESDDAEDEPVLPENDPNDELHQATIDEMGVIVQAYNQTVVQNGGAEEYEMLVGDIVNPLAGQAHGWGVKTEWLEAYNDGDLEQFALWMQISQFIVYEEDLEAVSD